MASERVRVVMMGSPRTAYAFESEVEGQGLTTNRIEEPLEQRSQAVTAARYVFEVVGDGTLVYQGVRAAAKKLRELFPGIEIETEGDEDE